METDKSSDLLAEVLNMWLVMVTEFTGTWDNSAWYAKRSSSNWSIAWWGDNRKADGRC